MQRLTTPPREVSNLEISQNLPKSLGENGANGVPSSVETAEGTMELLAAGAAGGATLAMAIRGTWVCVNRQHIEGIL